MTAAVEAPAESAADAWDMADAEAVKARPASGETEAFPVPLFREHRAVTARGPAESAGVAPSRPPQIEYARHPGRIAAARAIPLDRAPGRSPPPAGGASIGPAAPAGVR